MNSNKYIFKKKFDLKRKSTKRLCIESAFMFTMSLLLVYINYSIPNKNLLLQSIPNTLSKSIIIIIDLTFKLFDIFLIIYIFISSIIAFILLVGSIYRIIRVSKRKTKIINYK